MRGLIRRKTMFADFSATHGVSIRRVRAVTAGSGGARLDLKHPEYHAEFDVLTPACAEYAVDDGRTNPFLHMSMHLAIAEQFR